MRLDIEGILVDMNLNPQPYVNSRLCSTHTHRRYFSSVSRGSGLAGARSVRRRSMMRATVDDRNPALPEGP